MSRLHGKVKALMSRTIARRKPFKKGQRKRLVPSDARRQLQLLLQKAVDEGMEEEKKKDATFMADLGHRRKDSGSEAL